MTGFLALVGAPPLPSLGLPAWRSDRVALHVEAAGRPNGPTVATRGPFAVAGELRLDNRGDLRRALREAPADDAGLLLAAYERWGEAAVDRLIGPFAFLLWDARSGRALAARDGVGFRPLFRARVGEGWAFGSSLPTVRSLVPFRVDAEGVAAYLRHDQSQQTRTLAAGVERIPAGHLATVRPGEAPRDRRFWHPDRIERRLPDNDQVVEQAFREAFDEAVRVRLDEATGALLSGGLDSSSIVTTARHLHPQRPLDTFSLEFADPKGDERAYIGAVLDADAGLRSHRVDATEVSMFGALDRQLDALGQPPMTANLFLIQRSYAAAREAGLRAILDGTGGDNVVGYGLEWLAELARTLRWGTLARETRALTRTAQRPTRSFLKVLRAYALVPHAPRLRRPEPVIQFGHAELAPTRTPAYRSSHEPILVQLMGGQVASNLEEDWAAATAVGVEARFPFLDRRVAELCLAVPSSQRLRRGVSRSFLRRAMGERLPAVVRTRRSKGDLRQNFLDAMFDRDEPIMRALLWDDAPTATDVLDVPALQAAFEHALRVPEARMEAAFPLWQAAVLARWIARSRAEPVPSPSLP